jgi:hypothetical protein
VAAVLGGVLWEAWGGALLLMPGHFSYFGSFAALVVPLLFSVALVGLYTTLSGWWKLLGGMGLVLAGAGLFVALCGSVWAELLPMADVTPVCFYFAERGLLQYVLNWVPDLCTALVVIGAAVLGAKALGRWSVVPLAGGLFGWVFYVTDFGRTLALFLANIAFGLLFGLSWVGLGYVLWQQGRQQITG